MDKSTFLSLIFLFLIGCSAKPKIPISESLELALDTTYPKYVALLNSSADKDPKSLKGFLEIDYIGGTAGYDHGWMIIQLMRQWGDKDFSSILETTTKSKQLTIKNYIEVGAQGSNMRMMDSLMKDFPRSFKLLGFTGNR